MLHKHTDTNKLGTNSFAVQLSSKVVLPSDTMMELTPRFGGGGGGGGEGGGEGWVGGGGGGDGKVVIIPGKEILY